MSTCQHLIKSVLCSFATLFVLFSFVSCGNNHPVESQQVSLAQIKPAELTKENDKQFLVHAVEMKYEQILLGKLAQRRATSEAVKELSKMLEETNRSTKSDLAALGIIKSISVPSVPTKSANDAYDKLNESTVEDFDYAYLKLVIQGYNDAISHFENATGGNLDPDIKKEALAMLPDMRNHLAQAIALDGQMNPISEVIR